MIQHLAGHLGTNIFTPFGGIGVTIFLVLSGFGLNESLKKNGINGFITKKFYRIWLPFFLFYAFLYLYKEKLDIISFIKISLVLSNQDIIGTFIIYYVVI